MQVDKKSLDRPPVTSGVPEGSMLGSILFLIYTKDAVNVMDYEITINIFADDPILHAPVRYETIKLV